MLHYIYTRSFIGIITFMALALAAWGALPARVGQCLVHYAGEKKTNADSSASGSIKLAKERIELMKRYGVTE